MTELINGAVQVRVGADGAPTAVLIAERWMAVKRVTSRWFVEKEWWHIPVRRHYHRCLLEDGECIEIYRDLESREWRIARRYD